MLTTEQVIELVTSWNWLERSEYCGSQAEVAESLSELDAVIEWIRAHSREPTQ